MHSLSEEAVKSVNASSSEGKSYESMKPLWIIVVAILVVITGYFLAIRSILPGWAERGQFGDMFGAANTFFSGLAFAALTYSLYLQRKALSHQFEELRITRDELAKQSKSQEEQVENSLRAAKINGLGAMYQALIQSCPRGYNPTLVQSDRVGKKIQKIQRELEALIYQNDRLLGDPNNLSEQGKDEP